MGTTYSDLYAGVGIHSGLAYEAATDMPSAFAAMRQGGGAGCHAVAGGPTVPTIIFHGDRDSTVHPDNGAQAVEQAIGSTATQKKVRRGQIPGGHGYTHTIHVDGERDILEHWNIHGAGHACRAAARQAPIRIRRGRTQRRKCCVSAPTARLEFFRAEPAREHHFCACCQSQCSVNCKTNWIADPRCFRGIFLPHRSPASVPRQQRSGAARQPIHIRHSRAKPIRIR